MTVVPRPRFEFPYLRRIIPIGASVEMENRRFVLQSVELYEGGFIAIIDLEVSGRGEVSTFTAINARDDRGNRYIGQMHAGYGGGSPTGIFRGRAVVGFSPALNPDASALTFECTDVRAHPTSPIGFVDGVGHVYQQDDVIGGPWEATIPLIAMSTERVPVVPQNEPPLPEQDFASLIHVVPVSQQQVIRDVGVTVLSLELYRSSFVANVRIDCPGRTNALLPHQGWTATDDARNSYRCYDQAGSGLFVWNGSAARMAYLFRPGLDAIANQTRLELDQVRLTYFEEVPRQYRVAERDGKVTIVGPWIFEIDLHRAS